MAVNDMMFVPPLDTAEARQTPLEKTPNITTLPDYAPFDDNRTAQVLLKACDNVSTDDIIPAGVRVLPYWSNIPKVARFAFEGIDESYADRAKQCRDRGDIHIIVAGSNYGQGSSRENAAAAPRYLGLQVVIANSFARIHWQNLVNFGVLPLTFADPADYERVEKGASLRLTGIVDMLKAGPGVQARFDGLSAPVLLRHDLSAHQIDVLLAGGAINWHHERRAG
jgi:aconitate hydratase